MADAGRVIGGSAGGLRLAAPGEGTRPFGDRVKQALFGSLETDPSEPLAGPFLDLFAGSGALAFEALMPVDVLGVKPARQRYGLFTNDTGGILDDLMFANRGDHIFVVVNAACKGADIAHMTAHLSDVCEVIPVTDRGLLALQGPQAEAVVRAVGLFAEIPAQEFGFVKITDARYQMHAMAKTVQV